MWDVIRERVCTNSQSVHSFSLPVGETHRLLCGRGCCCCCCCYCWTKLHAYFCPFLCKFVRQLISFIYVQNIVSKVDEQKERMKGMAKRKRGGGGGPTKVIEQTFTLVHHLAVWMNEWMPVNERDFLRRIFHSH